MPPKSTLKSPFRKRKSNLGPVDSVVASPSASEPCSPATPACSSTCPLPKLADRESPEVWPETKKAQKKLTKDRIISEIERLLPLEHELSGLFMDFTQLNGQVERKDEEVRELLEQNDRLDVHYMAAESELESAQARSDAQRTLHAAETAAHKKLLEELASVEAEWQKLQKENTRMLNKATLKKAFQPKIDWARLARAKKRLGGVIALRVGRRPKEDTSTAPIMEVNGKDLPVKDSMDSDLSGGSRLQRAASALPAGMAAKTENAVEGPRTSTSFAAGEAQGPGLLRQERKQTTSFMRRSLGAVKGLVKGKESKTSAAESSEEGSPRLISSFGSFRQTKKSAKAVAPQQIEQCLPGAVDTTEG